jgi:hypothetical protein
MAESDNILTKLQDLLVYLIPQLNKFPRDQKFVLGDRIETKLLDVQEFCLRAYYSREKRGHLLEANLQLEVARHLVRLANALKLFSNHTYGVLAEIAKAFALTTPGLDCLRRFGTVERSEVEGPNIGVSHWWHWNETARRGFELAEPGPKTIRCVLERSFRRLMGVLGFAGGPALVSRPFLRVDLR